LIESSEIEYKKTKLIKQGKNRIEKEFESIAKWISEKYNVNVLDIQQEFMSHNNMVRIAVHLETSEDELKFHESNDRWSNFDSKKQTEIAEKLVGNSNLIKIPTNKTFGKILKRKPAAKDIFVSFSAFKPIAMEETNTLIPEKRVSELQVELGIPEIWTISRCFDSVTLFVHKDEQKEKIKNSAEFKLIENKYFELLKEYDEFNYWKKEEFRIGIDSKQNFDENYESNWYYYYK
jgi:hypothetical protein